MAARQTLPIGQSAFLPRSEAAALAASLPFLLVSSSFQSEFHFPRSGANL